MSDEEVGDVEEAAAKMTVTFYATSGEDAQAEVLGSANIHEAASTALGGRGALFRITAVLLGEDPCFSPARCCGMPLIAVWLAG